MNTSFRRVAAAMATGVLSLALGQSALGAVSDYEFQLVDAEVKEGDGAVVSIRLVDKRTGETVPDAVIFETRADMAPDGMETMTTLIQPMLAEEPGVYRFEVDLVMQGGWRISLSAKIQGEEGTLVDELVLQATE